jgi:hypothetical protein
MCVMIVEQNTRAITTRPSLTRNTSVWLPVLASLLARSIAHSAMLRRLALATLGVGVGAAAGDPQGAVRARSYAGLEHRQLCV